MIVDRKQQMQSEASRLVKVRLKAKDFWTFIQQFWKLVGTAVWNDNPANASAPA
jgi:hypothetical protein